MKKNTTTKIHVGITDNYFNALSKQNLPMSSAACEIVDNTISNSKGPINSLVAVEEGSVKGMLALIFADWGKGMTIERLEESVQLGSRHTDEGSLCIHGVGLNNFLLVATRNKYPWFIATRKPGEKTYHRIDGPFSTTMEITEQKEIPLENIVMRDAYKSLGAPSTII